MAMPTCRISMNESNNNKLIESVIGILFKIFSTSIVNTVGFGLVGFFICEGLVFF